MKVRARSYCDENKQLLLMKQLVKKGASAIRDRRRSDPGTVAGWTGCSGGRTDGKGRGCGLFGGAACDEKERMKGKIHYLLATGGGGHLSSLRNATFSDLCCVNCPIFFLYPCYPYACAHECSSS